MRVASYDPNGNMTTRTESATYAQTFDVENRLTDVNGVRFGYDADGVLVKKVEGSKTTTYAGAYFEKEQMLVFVPNTVRSYGAQWKLDNAALPGGRTRKYYFFAGARVAMRENNGSPSWLHSDHLRSASLATDSNGQVVPNSEARYTPFGSYRGTLDGDGFRTNRRFQDAERVASIELDSMGARFYSAGFGRFISADTIVPGAGNPQSFNRYSFVLNNPLKFTDPSGHAQIAPEGNGCGTSDLRNCFMSQYQGFGWGIGAINYAEATLYQLLYERYKTLKPEGWEIKSEGLPEQIAQQYMQGDFNMPVAKRPVDWGNVVWTIMAQSGGLHMAGVVLAGTKPGGSVDIWLRDPKAIKFSQDSINSTFKEGQTVQDMIDSLKSGAITANDVEPIRVVQHDGKVWTLDNRRLYAFQQANQPIRTLEVNMADISKEWNRKFTTNNGGESIRVR